MSKNLKFERDLLRQCFKVLFPVGKWTFLLLSVQEQYRLIQQIMEDYHNPFDFCYKNMCLICEERCLTCWRIWWAKNYRKCFWITSNLLAIQLSSWGPRKWSLHFKEGNISCKILYYIQYTAEVPVTLTGSGFYWNLSFVLSFIDL